MEFLRNGWRPSPFHTFVLKIHSRCNLACDYCYMYESADQRWRLQPRAMPDAVIDQVAHRIAEHAARHRLPRVDVVLHGGEPLLAGRPRLERILHAVRTAVAGTRVEFVVQSNGLLLDDDFLRLFSRYGVRVGLSLDGDVTSHDRHRLTRSGHGSHADVVRAIGLLSREAHRGLFAGLLCTVDLDNDPVSTYLALCAHNPPAIDFLLPHGNWSRPPPGLPAAGTPYADWLIPIFDLWYGTALRRLRVRLFEQLIFLLLGRESQIEDVGLNPVCILVVETDGSIEMSDALKSAYEGASYTGLHVGTDPFDRALLLPPSAARQAGLAALCATCGRCPINRVCGAGHYAHRYRAGSGFANPTVYCRDMYRLVNHISGRLEKDILAARRSLG
ncbi:FxsB family cyclophane-forming radical SAM/SPASM peptide maturase [Nonomuraea sp. NPDC050790]|uniref:FxsB family cyclophane-forming radical SAM/SPASM peptide maturase n=1 Tax=Nonomuraea sp. NPDC050790 TaxID=3364371 RepID=UPI0037A65293